LTNPSTSFIYRFSAENDLEPVLLEPKQSLGEVKAIPGAFSLLECTKLLEAFGDTKFESMVEGETPYVNPGLRSGKLAWIPPNSESIWVFQRLSALLTDVNKEYRFEIHGFLDPIQLTRYGIGGRFEWHADVGPEQTSLRKLSVTVQLSEPSNYVGGNLEFHGLELPEEARVRGTAIFFPSYMAHRVSPITAGERASLVAWACGSAFR
jgi:PKHD-type hydroxylase